MAKITKEQLDIVVKQQQELNKLVNEIGVLETRKHAALHKIAGVNEDIEATKAELEKEYGSINVDLKTGEYTIIEEEETKE
jgi:predicted  nucleic acid-binding Zn-ribbon protein